MTQIYNKSAEKAKRRQLRANMPLPEIILWSKLKGRGIGQKFRRQYSVGAFVLDFCCPILKLAIEVDGDSHYSDEGRIKDEERQKIIENYGFTFLRFTNNEITENLDGVLSEIARFIQGVTTPTPPCQGGDITNPPLKKGRPGGVKGLLNNKPGGEVAVKARDDLEKKTGRRVISGENYLTLPQGVKKTGKR